ncbi:synaptogenesis protein syg-2-like [Ruditapes philippinarum]|uniref:synaptogenesis protein syg-2-like n=1 Tax=Ruditapes philippinarum TaxID=129788 RepID=UPI00295BE175|nr:synaptogenesis protein syg-2-like [Ruditapes philippinarum]
MFVFCFGIFFFLKVSGQSTSLAIAPKVVDEGSPQTLTCMYSGSETVASVSWFANDITQGNLRVNGLCTKLFWRHENLHSWSCDVSRRTFKLTILSVTRNNRSDIWQCDIALEGIQVRSKSNNVTPSVKVPITTVAMTIPQSDTITILEKTTQQFRCITSGGLPEPIVKWYNDSRTPGDISDDKEITTFIIPSYRNTSDDLVITTSTLTLTASKYDNQINIYCSAYSSSDQTPLISTRKPKLNVLYAPDGPPVIQGFSAGTTYRVIENKPGQLTCLIKGGNPLPTLTWTCFNTGTSDNTDADTVLKTARWTAVRGQNRKCTCQSSHSSGSAMVDIQVQIIYPPTTPEFSIKNTKVVGTVKVIKHSQVSITCKSTGQPNQIQYTWKHNSAITSGATLTTNNIQNGDQYTCEVENLMNPSDGSAVTGKNSSSLSFDVLYPPTTPTFRYWNTTGTTIPNNLLNVIQNDLVKVACRSNSKPDPDTYQWDTRGNNQILTVSSITADKQDHMYKCEVRNTMTETVPTTSNPTRGTSTSTLTVHVMYPPTNPTFKYRYGQGSQNLFSDSLSVREFNPTAFTVICESNSRPEPVIVWENITPSSHILTLKKLDRSKAGNYNCKTENIMKRTFINLENVVYGRNFQQFELNILYPPEVGILNNRSIPEGKPFDLYCSVKVGYPKETTFKWLKSDGTIWSNQMLTIQNVSRTNAGFYTCTADNLMKQTGEQMATKGEDSKSFYLNVWYRAKVTNFYVVGFAGKTSVTVNETTSRVPFHCDVDSNPGSFMTIKKEEQQLHSGSDRKWLEYVRHSASCLDAGIYSCLANNTHNTELSSKQLTLFVNCSPRNSPLVPLLTNVISQQNKSAVFSFTALAHPVPSKNDFQWFRKANGQWYPLWNDAAFKIDTFNLQSNLTILIVNRTLFGMYRLTVNNVIGGFKQIFRLVQEDKPEVPTYFINKQELVTVSSFTVQWKPGFDNGPEQTFIVKYRKESQQEWTVYQIPDTRETLMNFTASDLSSGSNYQVVLYASNRLGNSSETDILTISTKVIPEQCHCENDRYQTIIVGVVFGIISVVVSVYGSYVTVLIRRIKRTKGQSKSSKENETKTQTYANLAYSINNSAGEQSTERSDTAEYTTLDNRFRDDNKTYDNINDQRT